MEEQNIEKIISDQSVGIQNIAETNFWHYQNELRAVWKISIFISLFLVIGFICAVIVQFTPFLRQYIFAYTIVLHLSTLISTVICLRIVDRKSFNSIGFQFIESWKKQFSVGIIISFGAISAIVCIELIFGIVRIDFFHTRVDSVLIVLMQGMITFIIIGFGEEILFRGYCFQAVLKGTNVTFTIVVSSIIFSGMHIMNPNIQFIPLINIVLAGVWFGFAYIRTKQLWLPIGLHIGWNFAQGTLFGFPVSGILGNSIFVSVDLRQNWISGGAFGPEGGILASIMILIGIAMTLHPKFQTFFEPKKLVSQTTISE